jgi:biotin synthase
VKEVNKLDMEVCCTLGMLTPYQAERLAEAGLYAYNHNIDTSEEHYGEVITTRTYKDRLNTIESVRKAGISVCSGGIIGLGETDADRIGMLLTLATLPQHPESVPINILVPVAGTPLAENKRVPFDELVRMIATARIVMPHSAVRLSAGRLELSVAEQAMCFMAGANSIFAGDKLLTTPNPGYNADMDMFRTLGLTPKAAFADGHPKNKVREVEETIS